MRDFDPDIRLRLTRYVAGDCSLAEAAELEAWLAADAGRQRELDALRQLWEASADLPPVDRVDEMWRDLVGQIRGGEQEPPTSRPRPPRPVLTLHPAARNRRPAWRRWGIGVAVAASLALAVAYGTKERWRPAAETAPVPAPPKEYRTTRGQRATIQLGDGTRIELGVASVLRVHPFARGHRDVELEGEAVFEVAHDPAQPFTVRSRNALIEDLGTRFAVRAYGGEGRVRVVVAEGKVALRPHAERPDTTAVLVPGDLGTIDSAGRTRVRHGVLPETYFGWVSGRLLFHNATLAEVAADLERWYEVDITFATPSLATRRVTLSMPVGALDDALDAITAPLGLAHTLHGTIVTLHAR